MAHNPETGSNQTKPATEATTPDLRFFANVADEGQVAAEDETSSTDLYNPWDRVEELPLEQHLRLVDDLQTELAKAQSDVRKRGAGTAGRGPLDILDTYSELLVRTLTTEDIQKNVDRLDLRKEGFEMLSYFLNMKTSPSAEEILSLKNIVDAQPVPEQPNEREVFEVVKEKTRPDYWLLDDDERAFYQRVAAAVTLRSYEEKQKPKKGVLKFAADSVMKVIAPPKYPELLPKPKFEPTEENFLSDEDRERVLKMWSESPRHKLDPHVRMKNPTDAAILGAVKADCVHRLMVDAELFKKFFSA